MVSVTILPAKIGGFYSTPSINGRLKNEGFKTALVENLKGQVYVMSVDSERIDILRNIVKTKVKLS